MNKKTNIDFYGKRKYFFFISIFLILLGLIFNIVFGAKLDIQFVGGAMVKYSVSGGEVDASEVQNIISTELKRDATVTVSETIAVADAEQQVTISFAGNEGLSLEDQQNIADVLTTKYDQLTFELNESNSVDPVMGTKFFQKCLVCLAITIVLLLVYIGFRFRNIGGLSAGVTAVIALFHDVIIIYFTFVIFNLPINDIFIAVILTILGYSLNDTIVIYDRIRENRHGAGINRSLSEVVNLSLNQTFGRSVMTSFTTFTVLLIVTIVSYIYGLTTVMSFSLPLMIGVVSGCYSSLTIAAPLYTLWNMRHKKAPAKPNKSKIRIK